MLYWTYLKEIWQFHSNYGKIKNKDSKLVTDIQRNRFDFRIKSLYNFSYILRFYLQKIGINII